MLLLLALKVVFFLLSLKPPLWYENRSKIISRHFIIRRKVPAKNHHRDITSSSHDVSIVQDERHDLDSRASDVSFIKGHGYDQELVEEQNCIFTLS
jgi:hypothetical protein